MTWPYQTKPWETKRDNVARNHEQRVKAAERQKQALQLRQAGVSYDDIAARLGYAGRGNAPIHAGGIYRGNR